MTKGIVITSAMLIFLFMTACSENRSSNQKIEEAELNLIGTSENWEAEALITTKVSVSSECGSIIMKPLDSNGEINLTPNFKYDEDIEVEYFLSRFNSEGKEVLY
ncbi:hypothetical protein LGQ02_10250 [Bacillus shivajii]|uniref:hypothetical protein n=1 Tax=Bacillus shivajii TaxID=1983719 RepID=UPI001CFAEE7F|nr:hypothetical protein [Bacillus shivajii]UCZ55073.1 hypothetical protein LGQ02_10250 [Bacillus shivajii]